MWHEYINAVDIKEVLELLSQKGEKTRLIAGGTDLILELERGVCKGVETLIDITRIADLDQITLDEEGNIHLGSLVTHNQCLSSKLIKENAFPLAQASWSVGSPQIRNRGTIAGNLITASPANDTISPLVAMDARVKLISNTGSRIVPLKDFYTGVRKTIMNHDEMLVDISIPSTRQSHNHKGLFIKHALRRAQAISLVNETILLYVKDEIVNEAFITLGAVAPTIIHAEEAEKFLIGKKLSEKVINEVAKIASKAASPISDIRSSKIYREEMINIITKRGLKIIFDGHEYQDFPEEPIMLMGKKTFQKLNKTKSVFTHKNQQIETKINGKKYLLKDAHNKTLLKLIRDHALLIGTKDGCEEGECGACTVFLDGMAVMSCLVPAPRAHNAEIITIEGLSKEGKLNNVQQAFLDEGAVQCGYCTPGFIMAATKLLDEKPKPSVDQIKQAITGNLCRCTGYYKIIKAIEKAAQMSNM